MKPKFIERKTFVSLYWFLVAMEGLSLEELNSEEKIKDFVQKLYEANTKMLNKYYKDSCKAQVLNFNLMVKTPTFKEALKQFFRIKEASFCCEDNSELLFLVLKVIERLAAVVLKTEVREFRDLFVD